MKPLTAIIYPGESGRWLVAFNPETGTISQGRTVEQALKNLKEATEIYLEEKELPDRAPAFLTTFEVAHA
jgi:predicted RNase H-like HicB family nuclease